MHKSSRALKSSNAAPARRKHPKIPARVPVWVSRLGFRAYPITPRPRRDRRFARVHGARAPLSRVAIDAMKIIEAIDRDRVGDARADAREHDDDRPSRRRTRRDRTRRAIASKRRRKLYVLVAVRAPDHHGLGVGDLAGGDGDGLRDLRGGLGDGRHDLEISVRLCRARRGRRARQGGL